MKRFKVLCKGEVMSDGELVLTIKAKSEEDAIKKVHKNYKNIESVEIINGINKYERYRPSRCPVGVMNKRTTAKSYTAAVVV